MRRARGAQRGDRVRPCVWEGGRSVAGAGGPVDAAAARPPEGQSGAGHHRSACAVLGRLRRPPLSHGHSEVKHTKVKGPASGRS